MRGFRRALRSIAGRPLAYQIRDGFGLSISGVLEAVARGRRVSDSDIFDVFGIDADFEMTAAQLAAPAIVPTNRGKSIAIVSMRGVALYDLEMQPMCFSTLNLARVMTALVADETVGTIILDVDSPGGAVTGTQEAADAVWAARQAGKVVVALVSPLCASAAYWIASQANEIVAVPSADIGSIGVFMAHTDCSAWNEQQGLKVTYIFAGKYKVEGNSDEPLSDEARAYYQSEVDVTYAAFTKAVARGRGVPVSTVLADFGQGRTMMAPAAKAAGMIDRVTTLDLALGKYGLTPADQEEGRARRRRGEAAVDAAEPVENETQPIGIAAARTRRISVLSG